MFEALTLSIHLLKNGERGKNGGGGKERGKLSENPGDTVYIGCVTLPVFSPLTDPGVDGPV